MGESGGADQDFAQMTHLGIYTQGGRGYGEAGFSRRFRHNADASTGTRAGSPVFKLLPQPTVTILPDPGTPLIDADDEHCVGGGWDQRGLPSPENAIGDIGAAESLIPIERTVDTPNGQVTFVILNGIEGGGYPESEAVPLASLPTSAPSKATFPYGTFQLDLAVYLNGWPVEVQVSTPTPTNKFWKYLNGEWVQFPASLTGNTWTFRLVDGGYGDADGIANGVIADPIALGIAAAFTG